VARTTSQADCSARAQKHLNLSGDGSEPNIPLTSLSPLIKSPPGTNLKPKPARPTANGLPRPSTSAASPPCSLAATPTPSSSLGRMDIWPRNPAKSASQTGPATSGKDTLVADFYPLPRPFPSAQIGGSFPPHALQEP